VLRMWQKTLPVSRLGPVGLVAASRSGVSGCVEVFRRVWRRCSGAAGEGRLSLSGWSAMRLVGLGLVIAGSGAG